MLQCKKTHSTFLSVFLLYYIYSHIWSYFSTSFLFFTSITPSFISLPWTTYHEAIYLSTRYALLFSSSCKLNSVHLKLIHVRKRYFTSLHFILHSLPCPHLYLVNKWWWSSQENAVPKKARKQEFPPLIRKRGDKDEFCNNFFFIHPHTTFSSLMICVIGTYWGK